MNWVFEPEIDGAEVLEFSEATFHTPCGCAVFSDHIPNIIAELQFDHIQLCIRVSCKHTTAGRTVDGLLSSLASFAVVMAVNRRAASFVAYAVKLVAEGRHIRSAVFITGDNLVDRVDDNGVQAHIFHTANQLGHQLVQRHRMPAQVPENDVLHVLLVITEHIANLYEALFSSPVMTL